MCQASQTDRTTVVSGILFFRFFGHIFCTGILQYAKTMCANAKANIVPAYPFFSRFDSPAAA